MSMRESVYLYTKTDQWQEAKDMYAAVLTANRKLNGRSQQDFDTDRANHAVTSTQTGKAAKVVRELQNVILQMENSHHSKETDLAATKVNLAAAFLWQDQYDEAESLSREALFFYHGFGGEGGRTRSLVISLKALADVCYHQQKWSCAVKSNSEYLEILDRRSMTVDEDHSYALAIESWSETRERLWDDTFLSLPTEIS